MKTKIHAVDKKQRQIRYALLIVLILVVTSALVVLGKNGWSDHSSTTPNPTPTKGNSTIGEPKTPPVSPSPAPTVGTPAAPPAKPTLQKSSGNAPGSSVPAGLVIEFICEGTAGLRCDVILTDRQNPSHTVNLGAKTVTSNNRESSFAMWDWPAQRGSWDVAAKIYGAGGTSAVSDSQMLEVK